jgi:LacI family transcriptional regulator
MIISDITNPFFRLVVRGAETAAQNAGYVLNIFNTDDQLEREQQVFSLLQTRRVDGVLAVVAPNSTGDVSHLSRMRDCGIPVVCLDRIPPGYPVDAVVVNNRRGAAMCVRHLLSLGHRSIGFVSGSLLLQTALERFEGFKQSLAEAGLTVEESLVREGDFRIESGYRLAKDLLLNHPRPTALFAVNGTMGLGALKPIDELGFQCPKDIALAVFDEVPSAEILRPHLTAVVQPALEIGVKATELLIERMSGILSRDPALIVLEPELKVRESTVASGGNRSGVKRAMNR